MKAKRFICVLLTLVLFLCVLPVSVFAAENKSGHLGNGVFWEVTANGELIISGDGYVKDYSPVSFQNTPWYAFREEITSITVEEGITDIGCYSLVHTNAVSVSLPDSLYEIRSYAFMESAKLKKITIPSGVGAIDAGVFKGCTSLEEITISENVELSNGVFYGCTNLKKADIKTSSGSFANLFADCTNLKEVTLSPALTSIPYGMFKNCSSLEDITIPSSAEFIGASAFSGCESLTRAVLPDGLESIGDHAFYNCTSLCYVVIPASVTKINSYAFAPDCTTYPRHVLYKGSKDQWEAIRIDSDNVCIDKRRNDLTHILYNASGNEIVASNSPDILYSCTDCGEVFYKGTKTFRHSLGKFAHFDHLSNGHTHFRYCSKSQCGYTEYLDAPYNYSDWEETTPASCTAKGEATRVCLDCNKKETKTVDKTDHTFEFPCSTVCSNPECDFTREATCEYGEFLFDSENHYRECIHCHTLQSEAPHEFDNGVCAVCGYSPIQSEISSEDISSEPPVSSDMFISSEGVDSDSPSPMIPVIVGLFALAAVSGAVAVIIIKKRL